MCRDISRATGRITYPHPHQLRLTQGVSAGDALATAEEALKRTEALTPGLPSTGSVVTVGGGGSGGGGGGGGGAFGVAPLPDYNGTADTAANAAAISHQHDENTTDDLEEPSYATVELQRKTDHWNAVALDRTRNTGGKGVLNFKKIDVASLPQLVTSCP